MSSVPSLVPSHREAPVGQPVLHVKGLGRTYGGKSSLFSRRAPQNVIAAADVNLTLRKGEILGIVGESGSGKSTVARCICLLYTSTFSGALLPAVDHLPHTHNLEHNAYSKGQPAWGAQLADELERIVALHDASTIAAVIVEPMAGSTGVLIPPKGYLEKLREITSKHGILLIFDEVITAYGRLGAATASEFFGVTPDLIAMAKGVSNAAVPAGAVAVRRLSLIHI